ncbi:MAG: ribonuclease HI [Clostridia bacterium]|nr:ribonuclease HI [Clostridia bacterium]
MKKIILYTDGACSGNPGAGGYCAILRYNDREKILSGGEKETTNNRMELMAVIMGLECLKEGCEVDVYSDSAYVVNAFVQDWISFWVLNNWRTKGKSQVLNVDLWQRLLKQLERHKVNWNKVKGHADNELNNKCDMIARSEISKLI